MGSSEQKRGLLETDDIYLSYGNITCVTDFSISDVVNNIMLLASALAFLQIYAYFQLPKKHAEAWEKSPMAIRLMITTGSFRLLQELIKMQIYANRLKQQRK